MRRALINPQDNSVVQLSEDGNEFPVAWPFFWIDAPEETKESRNPRNGDDIATPNAAAVYVDLNGQAIARLPIATHARRDARHVTTYLMRAGQRLPMHTHAYAHDTTCVEGEIEVERADAVASCAIRSIEPLAAGTSTHFPAGQAHEIRAVDDAVIVNAWTDPETS